MAYFLRQKNEERTAAFAEETRPGAFIAPVEYIPGHFLLHTLLEELNVKEVIDSLSAQNPRQFLLYSLMFTTSDIPLVTCVLNEINPLTGRLIQIARDGKISDDEMKDFAYISKKLMKFL